jgi:DNA-3-methyladenine glycosylase II
MVNSFTSASFRACCDALAAVDADMATILREHGYPPMWNRPNTFETLVHFILEQQVSLASALAALNKLRERVRVVTPENVGLLTEEELRACYFSRQKAGYVRYLAESVMKGDLVLEQLNELPDEQVRAALTKLKGIGNWTADVYLIFVLQRSDVFPLGDLAAVNALKRVKGLPKDTHRDALTPIIGQWKPHRTIATMLLWHYYLSTPGRR